MNNYRLNYKYKPVLFYSLSLLLTWTALFIAAYCSYDENLALYKYIFIYVGVAAPFAVALFLIYGSGNDQLKKDFRNRLTNFKLIKPKYLIPILLIMPVAVALATAISLLLGQPVQQFAISPGFSVAGWSAATLAIVVILAPTFEEMAWRGYGVDSLNGGRSLFKSTLIFALLWALWHFPLLFIKGYYHYEILQINVVYAVNFFVSVFAAAFLANWIFYKNGRSILANIIFHIMLNLSSSLLQTEQFTKCIVTLILLLACVLVFFKLKPWWLDKTVQTR